MMTLLPVVERELRAAVRRPATYRVRFGSAFASLVVMAWILLGLGGRGGAVAQEGKKLFYTVATLSFFYCLFAGVRTTADCISEEKREGTLGLLFLTDLKGRDVALGKLAATSLNAFYGLLAVFPVLALPLLLGGVTGREFGQMALVLANTLFFSLVMGLLVSTWSRDERKAAYGTVLAVLLPALIPLALMFLLALVSVGARGRLDLDYLLLGQGVDTSLGGRLFSAFLWLEVFSPITAFLCLALPAVPGIPWFNWGSSRVLFLSVGLTHLVAWAALARVAMTLPKVWRDRPASRLWVRLQELWAGVLHGIGERRREYRRALLNVNAFYWLCARDRLKPGYAWLYLFSLMAIGIWRYLQDPSVVFDFFPLVPNLILFHAVLKLWAIAEGAQRLVEDQRSGALELVLSTPLTIREVVAGHFLALRRQFVWPIVVLCGLELIVLGSHYPPQVLLMVQLVLVVDMITLAWLAMWLSLTSKSINRIVLLAAALVLVLPWFLAYTALGLIESMDSLRWFRRLPWTWLGATEYGRRLLPFPGRVFVWFILSLAVDAWVMVWARARLYGQFRVQVLRRFEQNRAPQDDRKRPWLGQRWLGRGRGKGET